jgi:ABC-type transporter Mla maintaining outer membrane lipid asymmetry permease subunit MlaE
VAPFRGKPLCIERAISQAIHVGVRCLPILSLITFFIRLILSFQAAYELRQFGAMSAVATAVAVSMSRELSSSSAGSLLIKIF